MPPGTTTRPTSPTGDWAPEDVGAFSDKRADLEKAIPELQDDFGIDRIPQLVQGQCGRSRAESPGVQSARALPAPRAGLRQPPARQDPAAPPPRDRGAPDPHGGAVEAAVGPGLGRAGRAGAGPAPPREPRPVTPSRPASSRRPPRGAEPPRGSASSGPSRPVGPIDTRQGCASLRSRLATPSSSRLAPAHSMSLRVNFRPLRHRG